MKQIFAATALALLLALCEQPTVDPDQKLRDTIVGRAWLTDKVAGAGDVPTPKMVFSTDGSVIIDSSRGSWSYVSSVFTITDPWGEVYKTASPSFDNSHFVFFYGPDTTTPQLIHLVR